MKSAKFEDEFVKSLIKQKEGEKLDFKQKITSKEKISKTMVGLANTEGGFILIGVSDNKKIIGIDPDEERYMVESANEEFCVPRVSLTIDEIKLFDEKTTDQTEKKEYSLLLVEVKKTQGPMIFCKNKNGELKSYIRVNDQTLAV
jgi:predicted HTH transcriptional regulator